MSIYEITAATTINATPEQVWAVLDNIHKWPEWMPSTRNLKIDELTPGPPHEGYRFRFRGKVVWAIMEVTTCTPLERMTSFSLNLPPLTGTNRCLMIPQSDGRYRIERIDQLVMPGPVARFLDKTQRDRFESIAAEFLLSLKRTAERRHAFAEAGHTQRRDYPRSRTGD